MSIFKFPKKKRESYACTDWPHVESLASFRLWAGINPGVVACRLIDDDEAILMWYGNREWPSHSTLMVRL